MNHTDIKAFVKSHTFFKIVAILGACVIALVIFEAGVMVGFHKASFAYHWQEHYGDNFGMAGGMGRGGPNPHGTTGRIVSVSLPTFVVAGPDENERTVEVDDDTIIRDGNATASTTDLAPGKTVVVLGTPNDTGTIDAGFIRVMQTGTSTQAR